MKHSSIDLASFKQISLEETAEAALQSRVDYKYMLNESMLNKILQGIAGEYDVMQINGKSILAYDTLYYDYPNFRLYQEHHNGKLNRYKVRCREYVDTKNVFVEVKFKNNKGKTIKTRISTGEMEYALSAESKEYIEENYPLNAAKLEPKLSTKYDRITLVAKSRKERVTIDINLEFDNFEKKHSLKNVAIIEVKKEKDATKSPMALALKKNKIYPSGISKYCMGVLKTYEGMKYNNFKRKQRQLEKLGAI